MKKELLTLHNYSMRFNSAIELKQISLTLIEGESTSFLGLISSGKTELVKVISGDEWQRRGRTFLDGEMVREPEEIRDTVHTITEINYAISDWTVAEYIALVSKSNLPWIFEQKRRIQEVKTLFDELEMSIDINSKLSDLSEVEKRMVDLVKAYREQSKILILEDEFSGLSNTELFYFKDIMNRIIKNRMTVVINANSNNVNEILADNYVILKKGRIIKKCKKEKIENVNQLERILLETSNDLPSQSNNDIDENKLYDNEVVYSVKGLKINNNRNVDFSFAKGHVTAILCRNREQKESIFDVLSGRQIDKNIEISIDKKLKALSSIADFVDMKIVSAKQLGTWDELMDKLSVGENILMPSLKKFTMMDYIKNGNQMSSMLKKQLIDNEKEYYIDKGSKNSLRSIFLVMERWYVFSPKVLILYEPFYQCDIYGISIIKTYISKFKKTGTSVIIVKSRRTDIEDISDNIIRI